MRVDQTFHVDLSELGNVHNGDGEGIAVELDGRHVPVRAHEGCAVGEKDRVIEHCVQPFHQRVIGLRSHALSRAVDVWDDAGVHAVLHAQRAGFVHDLAALRTSQRNSAVSVVSLWFLSTSAAGRGLPSTMRRPSPM